MSAVRRAGVVVVGLLLAVAGCTRPDAAGPPPTGTVTIDLGDRPFTLHVPAGYRSGTAAPLLILLHGYTSSGEEQERYLRFAGEAEKRGVLYATPDGTKGPRGNRFWNATDACCNFAGSTVDDGAYLLDVIAAVAKAYTVDTKRVYLFGHSNGGFMSYRMACDHADAIAAIAALNGAMWNDPAKCRPSRPVSVLHIRGTNDETILNAGGTNIGVAYPSTAQTVADWAALDGCGGNPDSSGDPLDLERTVAGAETTPTRYACQGTSRNELWTMKDSGHVPAFTDAFAPAVFDFLLDQSLT